APWRDDDLSREETRQDRIAHLALQRPFDVAKDRAIDGVHLRARLLDRRAWRESRENVDPVRAPIVDATLDPRAEGGPHGECRVEGRTRTVRRSAEVFWRDTDDRRRPPVHRQRFADDARVRAEVRLPEPVCEDNGWSRGRIVVWKREEPAECGPNLQNWKV